MNVFENSQLEMGIIFGTQFIKTHKKRNEKDQETMAENKVKKPSLHLQVLFGFPL